jgi:SRSO17 transposase
MGRGEDPGRRGHGAVDRELYVPRSWTSGPDRCRDAGLDQDTAFATKPELATRMAARFLDAGHQAAWVAGDEIYGGNLKLRTALDERGTGGRGQGPPLLQLGSHRPRRPPPRESSATDPP